ncbi:MAG: HD-GYP domain-containing protein [Firmicutes bacterium]|nr:HD-GYP domain-containing protein [Bacillota bacterium]
MRLVNINDVEVGSQIAKPVYDSKLSLLINKGAKLSETILNKLINADIRHLYIEDEISKGVNLEPMISDELKLQAFVIMKQIYESQMNENKQNEAVRESTIKELKDLVDDIITEIYSRNEQKYFSTELMGAEMYHYNHSVEVMILSLLIGRKMGLDRERLLKLGMGAMLCDIGKSRVPQEILNKKGKLDESEFDEMKRHVDYSYAILKDLVGLSSLSRQIVLLHHEKLDGTGYPNGFTGDQIPLLVRIATVCDIFSAIVSDRTYNNRISVDTAIEILRSATPLKLDQDVFQTLLQVVDIYPPGTLVELGTGQVGIVIESNPNSPTRPKIRILSGNRGEIIDLMQELSLFIKKVVPKLT